MSTQYFVCNENTLCYQNDGDTCLGVLADKPIKGGRAWLSGPFTPTPSDRLRPATLADFDYYRVDPTGHIA